MAAHTTSRYDVVVVGAAGIDTNVYAADSDLDGTLTVAFTETKDYVGQAGGYSARGWAQLGYRTAFVGHVGDDPFGHWVRERLASDGVDVTAMGIDPRGTARSVNLVMRDGRRRAFYDPKGNADLDPPNGAANVAGQAAVAHVHLPRWTRRLLPELHGRGVVVAVDLQDVFDLDDEYRSVYVSAADILFLSGENLPSPEKAVAHYLSLGGPTRVVVCGMGAGGCLVGAHGNVRQVPTPHLPWPVVDTNGAGDGLAVGFLSAYVLDRLPLEMAVQRGQMVARWTCAQRGSTDSLATASTVAEWGSAGA